MPLTSGFAMIQAYAISRNSAAAPASSPQRRRLEADLPSVCLPFDRPSKPRDYACGIAESSLLDRGGLRQLQALGRSNGASLYVTLLTAYYALLHRYTQQGNSIAETAIRQSEFVPHPEGKLKVWSAHFDLSGDPSFAEALARVSRTVGRSSLSGNIPQKAPASFSDDATPSNRPHAIQFTLSLGDLPVPWDEVHPPGIVEVASSRPPLPDLRLHVQRTSAGLRAAVHYNAAQFDAGCMGRMLGHLRTLIEGALRAPDRPLSTLPLLPDEERRLLLHEWTQRGPEFSRDLCLHQPIEAQVKRTPDAIAVVFESEALTYSELNCAANRLANRLIAHGVGPEVPVAVLIERSLEMAVTVLGLLKAGGVLVPLDPEAPSERLELILRETATRVILTRRDQVGRLPPYSAAILCVDDIYTSGTDISEDPTPPLTPDNLCGIFFTSGSTGEPKGVLLPHRVCCRILWAQTNAIPLSPSDRRLLTSSLNYASFLGEFCAPLFVGGAVVFARPNGYQDVEYLLELIDTRRITVAGLVPSVLRHLLDLIAAQGVHRCRSLRHIFSHGDSLSPDLRRLISTHLRADLHNFYGLTEAAVITYWNCRNEQDPTRTTIGRPTDMNVYLLDRHQQMVPIGIPGEIYVGGDGMAQGYLGRPELTAERFVPNPFNPNPASRLFRTGDLGRWLPEGVIEFLGRVDDQVKVHGVRIDVHEVEAALAQHPAVGTVVVALQEPEGGKKRLAAWVERKPEAEIESDELRRFLKDRLPGAMIPSAFFLVRSLPRNANGKIDRRATIALRLEQSAGEIASCPPRTPVESALAQVWADVLGLAKIGVFDNFFELGGDSIRAVQVVSRARHLGLSFSPSDIFEHDSVASLSAAVRGRLVRGSEGNAAAYALVELEAIEESVWDKPPLFSQMQLTEQELEALLPLLRKSKSDGEIEIEDLYPLSPLQQGMLFHVREEVEAGWYFQQFTYRLRVAANQVAAHRRAWEHLLGRHSALRTAFFWGLRDEPFQVVYRSLPLPWEEHDLRDLSAEQQAARLESFRKDDLRHGFNLSSAPLIRLAVFQLADDEVYVLFTYHHMVLDGWSAVILFEKELIALHEVYRLGGTPSLLPSPKFGHYISWIRNQDLTSAEAFWRRELSGFRVLRRIQAGRSQKRGRSPEQIGAEDRAVGRLQLSEEATSALIAFGRKFRLTLTTLVQAAWGILLSRYSGSDDIVFGATVACRPPHVPGAESMVGLLMNTLVVRVKVEHDAPLVLWLRKLQAHQVEAREFEYTPLVDIQKWSEIPRQPLFESNMVIENLPSFGSPEEGGRIQLLDPRIFERTNYPLNLQVMPGRRLAVAIEYDRDRFEVDEIQRILAHLGTLLESFCDPDQLLRELPPLPVAEWQQLIEQWNDTFADFPMDRSIDELIEDQVQRTPEAIAVVCDNSQLTYRELNERANKLAYFLRKLGVGPDVIVGIALERSLESAVALLGVLKAGGAYLPLDPALPTERLNFMLQDAQASLVMTSGALRQQFQRHPIQLVCLDSQWDLIASESGHTPEKQGRSNKLAYVMYTSGSTGRPHGVLIAHRGLVNHSIAISKLFNLCSSDRVLQFAPLTFDCSADEIFPTWIAGATLVLRTDQMSLAPSAFAQSLSEREITVLFLPTAYWHEWTGKLAREAARLPEKLRLVWVCGEEPSASVFARWKQVADPHVRWLNAYGPTETTISVIVHEPSETALGAVGLARIPIGRPLPNVQALVLDARLQPVPIGVPGELCISGEGLARGYHNLDELTKARFAAHPFSSEPGTRLYRTGDLARYRSDGVLEFLGRIDHQIKIRGFRVEPAEIETVLHQHRAVRHAAVLARDYPPDDKRLVAYVVLGGTSPVTQQELRHHLEAVLPSYMVPTAFVFLASMPLTPSGKIDRLALCERYSDNLPAGTFVRSGMRARDVIEDQLTNIWASLLGVWPVGTNDDFFDLGGHSLLALRLLDQIEKTFGVKLAVTELYRGSTIEKLTRKIRETIGHSSNSSASQSAKAAIFCVGYGLNLAQHFGWEHPVYELRVDQETMAAHSRIETLAASYVDEVRRIQSVGPYILSGYSSLGIVAYEMAQQLQARGSNVALLAVLETNLFARPVRFFVQRVCHHARQFPWSSPSQWLNYIPGRAKAVSAIVHARLQDPRSRSDIPPWDWVALLQVRYRPAPYAGRIALFATEAFPEYLRVLRSSWSKLATAGLDVITVPGDHLTMVREPHVRVLAAELKQCILKATDS